MSKIIPIFLFAWVCLSVVGYFLYIGKVETDLNARGKAAVSAAGYDWLTISQQGRDLSLQGSAPDEDSVNDAANIVKTLYGVRVVETGEISIELPDQSLLQTKGDDNDGDGVVNSKDAFPDDASEQLDHDVDGVGDNADLDDDNDGVIDSNDAFPLDKSEAIDTDNDGVGNNADTDDDNDGYSDSIDAFAKELSENKDSDGDGVSDSKDIYPNDASRWDNEQIEITSIDENINAYNPCSIDLSAITSHTMIYFQTGSSVVDSEGQDLLGQLAALLDECPFYYVNIIGHTDLRGSQVKNQQLSEQRASNVESQLIDFGVHHQRIKASGAAASSPASDNMTTDGFAGNRRVEIALIQ